MSQPALATRVLTRVPFLDLGPSHRDLAPSLLEDFAELIESGAFTNGPAVAEFEKAFAAYCGAESASERRAALTRFASR